MECGRLTMGAALPDIERLNGNLSSEVFRTTTTIFPSGFMKAVACSLSRLVEQLIRLAPG